MHASLENKRLGSTLLEPFLNPLYMCYESLSIPVADITYQLLLPGNSRNHSHNYLSHSTPGKLDCRLELAVIMESICHPESRQY